MNSREERTAYEMTTWDEWSQVVPPHEMEPEQERVWKQAVMDGASVFSQPGPVDLNEPGNWFLAGYDSPCEYGDQIQEDDTIRADGFGGWEHKECAEAGEAMFLDRPEHATDEPEWTI